MAASDRSPDALGPAADGDFQAGEKPDTFRRIVVVAAYFRQIRRRAVVGISDSTADPVRVRNSYIYCEQFTTMSRSSTPWDDPDPDRRRTALPTDPALDAPDAPDVMASVDSSSSRPELVIADVSREDAWVSVDETNATVLKEWC